MRSSGIAVPLFSVVVVGIVYAGWRLREVEYLNAESGIGYGLGVAGAVMMTALLSYPVRKKLPLVRWLGPLRHWFRVHMLLGVVGPVCVLFHCNFHAGSPNSRVALASMLIVVASGIAGRYLYAKIHHGLYGRRATLAELRSMLASDTVVASVESAPGSALVSRLTSLSDQALLEPATATGALSRFVHVEVAARALVLEIYVRRLLGRLLSRGRRTGWSPEEHRRAYLLVSRVRRVLEFSFYERLFALWHVLHVPLFVMLVIATVFHVVAVHRY